MFQSYGQHKSIMLRYVSKTEKLNIRYPKQRTFRQQIVMLSYQNEKVHHIHGNLSLPWLILGGALKGSLCESSIFLHGRTQPPMWMARRLNQRQGPLLWHDVVGDLRAKNGARKTPRSERAGAGARKINRNKGMSGLRLVKGKNSLNRSCFEPSPREPELLICCSRVDVFSSWTKCIRMWKIHN